MLISVVIPTCDRNDLLARCLEHLAPTVQTLAPELYEVIVTDDAFSDTAEEIVKQQYGWSKWVRGPRRGPAANRNYGASHARGQWIVFTDDDCLPCRQHLQSYANSFFASKVLVFEGKTTAIGSFTSVDMECPINDSGGNLWACNFAINRNLFFKIGGFDESFPAPAMEDVDMRTRLSKMPELIEFVEGALVLHPWTKRKGFAFQRLHSSSVQYFFSKHPETIPKNERRATVVNLARRLNQMRRRVVSCRGKGVVREILLSFHYAFLEFKNSLAVSRLK